MPQFTVCGVPGCPTLTEGNYCDEHKNLTLEEEEEERRRLQAEARKRERRDGE